jgi:hypothetical protein
MTRVLATVGLARREHRTLRNEPFVRALLFALPDPSVSSIWAAQVAHSSALLA